MLWKDFVKDYFTFGKRYRVVAITLLVIIAIIYALPRIFKPKPDPNFIKVLPVLVKGIDSLEKNDENAPEAKNGYNVNRKFEKQPGYIEAELFQFDPNTISLEGWKKLGLNEKTATTIIKYRSKGGRFYKPEDLTRIWNLPQGFYDRVKNYIHCESIKSPFKPYSYSNNKSQKKEISIVEINQADTNAFIQLPGIGP